MTVIIRNRQQLDKAKRHLEMLEKAREKILAGGQAYSLGENQMTRADLKEISEEISVYENAIDTYERNGTTARRAKRAVPLG